MVDISNVLQVLLLDSLELGIGCHLRLVQVMLKFVRCFLLFGIQLGLDAELCFIVLLEAFQVTFILFAEFE